MMLWSDVFPPDAGYLENKHSSPPLQPSPPLPPPAVPLAVPLPPHVHMCILCVRHDMQCRRDGVRGGGSRWEERESVLLSCNPLRSLLWPLILPRCERAMWDASRWIVTIVTIITIIVTHRPSWDVRKKPPSMVRSVALSLPLSRFLAKGEWKRAIAQLSSDRCLARDDGLGRLAGWLIGWIYAKRRGEGRDWVMGR
ncbi:hypothetical protein K431DRAFT_73269 [Polychaeton citri CBS 116435]|uniref:Uncharacterized protein n=1 Tax=Polychaeton citri CBS 116435 TaxID=1314669 RepID=A0A9P4Q693_9PEZI|nr:hypothetical protein K431DRAFT_73269 [Polychaeton citri CBS 116435]